MSSTAAFEEKIKKSQKDIGKNIAKKGPMDIAFKEIWGLIAHKKNKKLKAWQVSIEHEKREQHIIEKKRERREKDENLSK